MHSIEHGHPDRQNMLGLGVRFLRDSEQLPTSHSQLMHCSRLSEQASKLQYIRVPVQSRLRLVL
jgi:hypothetical protein